MKKSVILVRFHKKPLVVKSRVKLLKEFNPGVEIYGLYGGKPKDLSKFHRYLKDDLLSIYQIKGDANWSWQNGDLALQSWFIDYGHNVAFDRLYLVEWDLLLLGPLADLYKNIPAEGVGLTALKPLREVEDRWEWTSQQPYKSEWKKLLEFTVDKYGYSQEPFASLGPGPVFPRRFLESFAKEAVPLLSNDELRLPLYAQVLGLNLYDTGFYTWFDTKAEEKFDCNNNEVDIKIIIDEQRKKDGVRVFHPYRKLFTLTMINGGTK